MRVKLLVQTQEFQSWPATKERAASTSHNLVCVDMELHRWTRFPALCAFAIELGLPISMLPF